VFLYSTVRIVSPVAILALLAACAGAGSSSPVPFASANGADRAPQRVVEGTSRGAAAPPSGTLYVAETGTVHAFPLGANGTTSSLRDITPHPNQSQLIAGLAVSADGTLDILESYPPSSSRVGGPSSAGFCRVVVESATASGSPPAVGTNLCDPSDTGTALGIATNTVGGYDVLFSDTTLGADILRRFGSDGTSTVSTLVLDFYRLSLAADRGGHDYIGRADGRVVMYKAETTDATAPASDVTLASIPQLGPIAVSPGADRTVYAVVGAIGSQNIDAFTAGSSTISRTIGPFPNNYISAMAVDLDGSLYVALNANGGGAASVIRVYDSAAVGKATPLRTIVPSPGVSTIYGLAIAQTSS